MDRLLTFPLWHSNFLSLGNKMNLKTIGLHFNLVEQIHSVRITGRWKMDLTACVLKMMFEY